MLTIMGSKADDRVKQLPATNQYYPRRILRSVFAIHLHVRVLNRP
jgi:hypothetical protein